MYLYDFFIIFYIIFAYVFKKLCSQLTTQLTHGSATVDRGCNNLAHQLAKRAKVHRSTHVWLRSFPEFVLEFCKGEHVNLSID
jgi:hypothetical protein